MSRNNLHIVCLALTLGFPFSVAAQTDGLPGLPPLPAAPKPVAPPMSQPGGVPSASFQRPTLVSPPPDAAAVTVVEITAGGQTQILNVSNRDMNQIEAPVDIVEVLTSKPIETKILGKNLFFHYTRTTPAELFIVTAKGTYTVLLQPQTVSARRIVLRDQSVIKDHDLKVEAKEPYLQKMKALMASMVQQQDAPGYTMKTVEEAVSFPGCRGIRHKIYTGSQFIGSVYILENASGQILNLREADFYHPGVLSVMVDNPQLLPLSPVTEQTWQSLAHVYIIEKRS